MQLEPYPSFSLDLITEPVRIVRQGKVKEEFPLLCKIAHVGIGVGFGATVGEPPGVEPLFKGSNLDEASDEQLQKCAEAFDEAAVQSETYGAIEGEKEKLDPATWLLVFQLASTLIKAIIERRRNKP